DAFAPRALTSLRACMQQLQEEQFLVGKATTTVLRFPERCRSVKLLHGLHECGQSMTLRERLRQRVLGLEQRQQLIEVLIEDHAQHLLRQALGRRIDRQYLACAATVFARRTEHDILARRDLAAVVEADGAGHEQQVTLADRAIEKRLAWP